MTDPTAGVTLYQNGAFHACPRCGTVREARPGSLCRDCCGVLSAEQRARWVA